VIMKRKLSVNETSFQTELKRRRKGPLKASCCDLTKFYNPSFDLESLPPPMSVHDFVEKLHTFGSVPQIVVSQFHINSLIDLVPESDILSFTLDSRDYEGRTMIQSGYESYFPVFNDYVPKSNVFNRHFGFWSSSFDEATQSNVSTFHALLSIDDLRFDFSVNFKADIGLSLLGRCKFFSSYWSSGFRIRYFSSCKKTWTS